MINPYPEITDLKSALSLLEDRIILTSTKNLDERIQAISELRYYSSLMDNYFEYDSDLRTQITVDLTETIGEIYKWLNACLD